MQFFIFGAGYCAEAFGRQSTMPIFGTTRSSERFGALIKHHIKPVLFPDPKGYEELKKHLKKTTHLLISIAPTDYGDPVLQQINLLDDMPELKWICYLSTVGVYGDHQGEWVNEEAICQPSLPRNKTRLQVEKEWQSFGAARQIPVAVLRLAGIYGPGRNAFIKLGEGKAQRIIKKGQVFSRIHSDDIAGVIDYFARNKIGGIYNLSDNEPAPPQDVITFAAQLMGISPPEEQPFETAPMSSMARSFYGDNKRISNHKLLSTGYKIKQKDYRHALQQMWTSGLWK